MHETIYQALYVQGRGELRRELTKTLRTGRGRRKAHLTAALGAATVFSESMVNISERPAEANDRAVPGHWEDEAALRNESYALWPPPARCTGTGSAVTSCWIRPIFEVVDCMPVTRGQDPHTGRVIKKLLFTRAVAQSDFSVFHPALTIHVITLPMLPS